MHIDMALDFTEYSTGFGFCTTIFSWMTIFSAKASPGGVELSGGGVVFEAATTGAEEVGGTVTVGGEDVAAVD